MMRRKELSPSLTRCRRGTNTRARANRHRNTQRENFSFCSFRGERERERESSLSRKLYICGEGGGHPFSLDLRLGFCFRVSLHSNEKRLVGNTKTKREKKEREFRLTSSGFSKEGSFTRTDGRARGKEKCRRRTLSSPSLRRRLPRREEEQLQQQQR